MMNHTSCFSPHASFDFNHPSLLFHERNPLLISSSSLSQQSCCSCSCSCCYYANNVSVSDGLGPINPSLLCKGLRQSTLIHWSFCSASGVSSFVDLDRNYYLEKISSVKEIRKKGFMGFGHKRKKQFSSNVIDDVEVMLNLLTDDVGLEFIDFKDSKKINKKHICCDDKEKKNVGFGVVKRDEVVKLRSLEREGLRKRNDKRKNLSKSVNLDLRKGDSGGDLEGDKNFEVNSFSHVGRTSPSEYMNDLEKGDHEVCIDEAVGNDNKEQECAEEQAKVLDTEKGHYGESVVSQNWRKKSEKRMNEEFNQHQSNVSVNIDQVSRQQHNPKVDRIKDESGSRMKYKRFEEMSDKDNSVMESAFNSQKQYNNTEKKLQVIPERLKTQDIDTKMASSSLSSKSRIKNWEENSIEVNEGVKENREEKPDDESEQDKVKASGDGSGSSHRKNGGSRHSSQGSGPKGPSDDMWHVTDGSTPEPSEPDAAEPISDSSENNGVVKSNNRSFWTIIGDVVRFRRTSPQHSGSHTPNSGGGRGSSYVAANCEAWFSSHEPDDSNDENMKKRSTKGLDSPLT